MILDFYGQPSKAAGAESSEALSTERRGSLGSETEVTQKSHRLAYIGFFGKRIISP
jgi:hypothetical protein